MERHDDDQGTSVEMRKISELRKLFFGEVGKLFFELGKLFFDELGKFELKKLKSNRHRKIKLKSY